MRVKVWLYSINRTSLVAQMVKRLLTMRKARVQSLGLEDPLEKEMATHFSIHAGRIPWTEEPGGLESAGRTWLSTCTHTRDRAGIKTEQFQLIERKKSMNRSLRKAFIWKNLLVVFFIEVMGCIDLGEVICNHIVDSLLKRQFGAWWARKNQTEFWRKLVM